MKLYVCAGATALQENKIWISSCYYNGLLSFDPENEKTRFEHRFELNSNNVFDLHSNIASRHSDLYLIPMTDKYIRIYDTVKKKEEQVTVPFKNSYKTCESMVLDNNVYLISNRNELLCFDMDSNRFDQEDVNLKVLLKLIEDEKKKYFLIKAMDSICLFCDDDKSLTVIDHGRTVLQKSLVFMEEKVVEIAFVKNRLWFLLFNSGDIYSMRLDAEDDVCVYKTKEKICDVSIPYYNLVDCFGKLLVLNYYDSEIRLIDEAQKLIIPFDSSLSYGSVKNYGPLYGHVIDQNKKTYIFPNRGRSILIFEESGVKQKEAVIDDISDEEKEMIFEDYVKNGPIVEKEIMDITLEDLLKAID